MLGKDAKNVPFGSNSLLEPQTPVVKWDFARKKNLTVWWTVDTTNQILHLKWTEKVVYC